MHRNQSDAFKSESSMNLDALEMDLDILDDLGLDDDLDCEMSLSQNVCEERGKNETKAGSRSSSNSLISPSMVTQANFFDDSSDIKTGKRKASAPDITKSSSETKKMRSKEIFMNKKVHHTTNDHHSTHILQDIPTKLSKANSISEKVTSHYSQETLKVYESDLGMEMTRDFFQSNLNIDKIRTLMPPIQAALFDSLYKASNLADLNDSEYKKSEVISIFMDQQQHSQNSLLHHMPITLPASNSEFYPFAQTHVKDFEPFNTLFPNIFKVLTKSSARYNPNTLWIQNPLQNLICSHIGTKIELVSKRDHPGSSKTHLVHLGIDKGSIAKGIDYIKDTSRKYLSSELKTLRNKINRQKKFLVKQMNQISEWYKSQFRDTLTMKNHSSKIIYSSKVLFSKAFIQHMLYSPNPLSLRLSVRIKCNGFQAPHKRVIYATIRQNEDLDPALRALGEPMLISQSDISKSKISSQSIKIDSNSNVRISLDNITQHSWGDFTCTERLVMINKLLDERASHFANKVTNRDERMNLKMQKQSKEIHHILSNHENDFMDSTTFFNLIKLICDWGDHTKEDMINKISSLYQPVFPEREIYWGQLPTPLVEHPSDLDSEKDSTRQNSLFSNHVVSSSLFMRLQSLLVDENSSGDESEEGYSSISWDMFSTDTDEDSLSDDVSGAVTIDVSALNLDQRSYLQLRASKLIDQPLLPSSQPKVIEVSNKQINHISDVNTDINSEIRQKQILLSNINKSNNYTIEMLIEHALADAIDADTKKAIKRF